MKTADISAEIIPENCSGSDLSVVNAARQSMNKWKYEMDDKDARLIKYLHKHKHTSPFNHCFLSFRCKVPIYVARQLVKHKFMPWNESSRRYIDSEPEFYFPEYYRMRATNVKQGSSLAPSSYEMERAYKITEACLEEYKYRLSIGVAPEQARDCLPQNMMVGYIWSGTLGAFLNMLSLRLAPDSQYESQILTRQIYEQVKPRFPVSVQVCIGDIE